MKVLREAQSATLVDADLAFAAVKAAFIALTDGSASVYPVVNGSGMGEGQHWTIKSGSVKGVDVVGAKIAVYWAGNDKLGIPCHSSTVFLLDPQTGRMEFAVEAHGLNGWRTAAADAVAASVLARPDSRTVAVIGAGNQAAYEIRALCACKAFKVERVLVTSRSRARAEALVAALKVHVRADVQATGVEEACRNADILVTATPSRQALFDAKLIRPGTHIAAMGSDRQGKQEIPVELLRTAKLFADFPQQSRAIGELQYVAAEIEAGRIAVTAIGDVLRGKAPGRTSREEITLFDSSGVSIQDLLVARKVVDLALARALI
jgi:ornithine cyclodeaminase